MPNGTRGVGVPSEPALIYRNQDVPNVLEAKGGGGSPRELRSDAGIFYQYELGQILGRDPELARVSATTHVVAVGGANLTVTSQFDPVVEEPSDHYLQGISFHVEANPANLESVIIFCRRADTILDYVLASFVQADVTALATLLALPDGSGVAGIIDDMRFRVNFPFYQPINTGYGVLFRSNAGGGFNARVKFLWSAARFQTIGILR